MKLRLHHINLCSAALPEMDRFYRTVLGMEPETTMAALRVRDQGLPSDVSFVTDGTTQFHLTDRDFDIGFRTGLPVNPLERGHIAFRTDDIAAFKRRLDDNGINYADYGARAVAGWQQIFFYDPEGNIIEVHQVMDEAAGGTGEAGRPDSASAEDIPQPA